jgi:hypothetical protein
MDIDVDYKRIGWSSTRNAARPRETPCGGPAILEYASRFAFVTVGVSSCATGFEPRWSSRDAAAVRRQPHRQRGGRAVTAVAEPARHRNS